MIQAAGFLRLTASTKGLESLSKTTIGQPASQAISMARLTAKPSTTSVGEDPMLLDLQQRIEPWSSRATQAKTAAPSPKAAYEFILIYPEGGGCQE